MSSGFQNVSLCGLRVVRAASGLRPGGHLCRRFMQNLRDAVSLGLSLSVPNTTAALSLPRRFFTSTSSRYALFRSTLCNHRPHMPLVIQESEVAVTSTSGSSLLSPSSDGLLQQESMTDVSAQHDQLARELSLLSTEEFVHRIHRFSRANFSAAQRPHLLLHLRELRQPHRLRSVSVKTMQDYIQLAYAAGLCQSCMDLYHGYRECCSDDMATPGVRSGGGKNSDTLFVESAALASCYVVDSAYALQNVSELTRIASYCVARLSASSVVQRDSNDNGGDNGDAGFTTASSAARLPRDVTMEMSLCRCLWRALCLVEYFAEETARGGKAMSGSGEQALSDAAAIYEGCLQVAQWRITTTTTVRQCEPESSPTAIRGAATPRRSAHRFLQRARRLIQYDTSGDDGEYAFFHLCVEEGLLPQPRASRVKQAAASGDNCAEMAGDLHYNSAEVQIFYAALIDSCAAGQHVQEAVAYFQEARRLLCLSPLVEDGGCSVRFRNDVMEEGRQDLVLPPESSISQANQEVPGIVVRPFRNAVSLPFRSPSRVITTDTTATTTTTTDGEGACEKCKQNGDDTGSADDYTEYLVHRLLFVLQTSKDHRRITNLARALVATVVAQLKVNMWILLLASASETRAVDLVLVANTRAIQHLRSSGITAGERRSWEYLLQSSLNALSKCQILQFEQTYLAPAQSEGLLHCTDEFYYCCLLQDAHNSMNPVPQAAALRARMEEEGVPTSLPIISRLLKLYLRAEAPEFLPTYQEAVEKLGLFRSSWVDQLLLWADRRRYFLQQEDRAFIIGEVQRVKGIDQPAELMQALGGLRTQFALLYYDYKHSPCAQFLQGGTITDGVPTTIDSRAHFLVSRPQCVQRGVMPTAGESWVSGGVSPSIKNVGTVPQILGDPARRAVSVYIADLSQSALLMSSISDGSGHNEGGRGSPDAQQDEVLRLYLCDVLEGLQRSSNRVEF